MVEILDGADAVLAVVDPQRPEAWRAPLVTVWLRALVDSGHPVIVVTGPDDRPYFLIRGHEDVPAVTAVVQALREAWHQRGK